MEQIMKIVQINSVSGSGSTGRIVEGISLLLDNKGYENYIFYGIGKAKKNNAFKFGNEFSKYVHIIKTRIFGKHGFYSKQQTKKLINKLKEIKPDIIHLHNIHGHYVDVKLLFEFIKKTNVLIIWTLHDCWSFTGHCAYFDYVNCSKWKTECNKCPALRQYPNSLIFDRSKSSYYDKKSLFTNVLNLQIVTPSKWLSNLVKLSFLKEYSTHVINNGVDLNIFKPNMNKVFRLKHNLIDKYIILGVSNIWEERKGLNYFLELSKILLPDEVIVLVGIDKFKEKNQNEKIVIIPRTNSIIELSHIYADADVFLNPTLEDNFPTTNIESISCGTPVVTFETGGSGESIIENCGIVLKEKTTSALRSAIDIMRSREKSYYVDKCREHAINNYDMNVKFDEYVSLYENKMPQSGDK